MGDRSLTVECPGHGSGYATFVCQHLARGQGRGFYTSDSDGDPRPDAWCFACEQVVNAAGEWDDESESFAGITLLCSGCYDPVRERNVDVRPSLPVDGWCLGTRADVLAVTADLDFPDAEAIAALPSGTYVKALFYIVGKTEEGLYVQGERMWVEIERHSDGRIVGRLASEPETSGALAEGAEVEIPYRQVLDVY